MHSLDRRYPIDIQAEYQTYLQEALDLTQVSSAFNQNYLFFATVPVLAPDKVGSSVVSSSYLKALMTLSVVPKRFHLNKVQLRGPKLFSIPFV